MKKYSSLILLFLAFNAYPQATISKQKTMYACPSNSDVQSCSSKCKRYPESTSVFMVDKQINSVMKKNYQNQNFQSSSVYKNCRIFDMNNWECIDGYQSDSMVDGIYIHTSSNPAMDQVYDLAVGTPFFCSK